jgi:hypothetical protein
VVGIGSNVALGQDRLVFATNASLFIYKRTGVNWAVEATIALTNIESVAISRDGTVVAAGVPNENLYLGYVYVYVFDGANWKRKNKRYVGEPKFGSDIKFNSNGTVMVVGAPGYNSNQGAAYVYRCDKERVYSLYKTLVGNVGDYYDLAQGKYVAITGNGNNIITASSDNTLAVNTNIWSFA